MTVTVQRVDHRVPLSLSGFTVSFNQSPEPRLLRLELVPVWPAPFHPAEDWRAPHIHTPLAQAHLDISPADHKIITRALRRLETLEHRQHKLNEEIEQQKKLIELHLGQDFDLKEEISKCDTVVCKLRTISEHIHDRIVTGVNSIYSSIHRSEHAHRRPLFHAAAGGHQSPTMLDHSSHNSVIPHVERPPLAHVRPNPRPDGYSNLDDEDVESGPTPDVKFRRPHRRHPLIAALHFILVIIGLAALFAFLRRRFSSLRTQTDRAASREERRNRRAYKRAARKAAFKNWWKSGWGRRRDARRRLDYEEKRALVIEGESRLEDAMQNEISGLRQAHYESAMQNEIRDLRRAHNLVDELIRAEEGRGTMARPVLVGHRAPGMASIAGVMMGGQHVPAHLQSPGSISSDDNTLVNTPPSSHGYGHSLSRTNSLPAYQTDPDTDNESRYSSDNPPSYRTDDDTDFDSDLDSSSGSGIVIEPRRSRSAPIVTNGFAQYAPSDYTPSILSPTDSASIFTPDSSIPDVSPCESAETVRTFM